MNSPRKFSTQVGARIRAERVKRGLRQDELATLAGVNRTTLVSLETNDAPNPRLKTLWSLCRALRIELRDVLDGGAR